MITEKLLCADVVIHSIAGIPMLLFIKFRIGTAKPKFISYILNAIIFQLSFTKKISTRNEK